MAKKHLIGLFVATQLAGCATISNWFAEDKEVEAETSSQNVIDKSNEAELEIDPNAQLGVTMVEQEAAKAEEMAMAEKAEQSAADETEPMNRSDISAVKEMSPVTQAVEKDRFVMLGQQSNSMQVKISKQRQIATSVENDYDTFRALNHRFIKNNTAPNQYKTLNRSVQHFVMDLVAKLSPTMQAAPLVVRPMKVNIDDVANSEGGKELITNLIASEMQDYGFQVFDGRRPKGRFTGQELILETAIESYGEQFVLYGTLRQLSNNKVAGTHQTFVSDYFFRNIQDGVEVY